MDTVEHGELRVYPDDAGKAVWVRETLGAATRPATVEELQTHVHASGYVRRTHRADYVDTETWENGRHRFHGFRVTRNASEFHVDVNPGPPVSS